MKTDLEKIINELIKKYGEGTVMKFTNKKTIDIEIIPTGSISLDHALGIGGIPRGRIVEIFGPESSGKTTLALSIIAQAQKKGIRCAYIDAEHSLDPDYSKNIGVDLSKMFISQPNSGEQALDITENFVKSSEIGLIVIDSVASLTPQAEIEGTIGQHHIGLQARLMSQALRKLTALASRTKTTIIFVNQIRMMIGIKWGCLHPTTKIHLVKGITEARKIKKNSVLVTFNEEKNLFEQTKINEIFDNGNAEKDEFIKLKIMSLDHNKYQVVILTKSHKILTEKGWRETKDLKKFDRLLSYTKSNLSEDQKQIVIGSLLGGGQIRKRSDHGESFSLILQNSEHLKYLKWKIKALNCFSFKKVNTNFFSNWNTQLQYYYEQFHNNEYSKKIKKKTNKLYQIPSKKIIRQINKLGFAIWFLDNGSFTMKKEKYIRNVKTAGISMKKFKYINNECKTELKKRMNELGWFGIMFTKDTLYFDKKTFLKFCEDIKEYVIDEMQYKIVPICRNMYSKNDIKKVKEYNISFYLPFLGFKKLSAKDLRSLKKYDFNTDLQTYMIGSSKQTNGIVVHNSPETTPGGTALKFYSSVRIEIRRAARLKKNEEIIGNRVKVKIAKNKLAAPFKISEFDIIFGKGISLESDVLAFGLKKEVIRKEGISLVFGKEKLGRGLESAKTFLKSKPELVIEIIKAIKEKNETESK